MIRPVSILVLVLAACGGESPTPNTPKGPPPTKEAGLAAYDVINSVLQHPRCKNCHPSGDQPLQGDEGRVHDQFVQRGPEGKGAVGMNCTTCHGKQNLPASYGEHSPPGEAKEWHMPPPETKMVIVGMTPSALCEQLKDPARNGHMDMKALRAHWDDPLVKWGWDPGIGRKPVPVPHEKLVSAFETWAAAGAPCPLQ